LERPFAPPWGYFRIALDVRTPLRPTHYSTAHGDIFATATPSVGLILGVVVERAP
jgi:hypothetical protein